MALVSAGRQLCLATVVTDSFVPGALAMLHSFLDLHPDFAGDIVVIHEGLAERYQECLRCLEQGVQFLAATDELQSRVDRVAAVFPEFSGKRARFLSLELFRLRGYDKVLFCDGDLLFRRPIGELFDLTAPLVACGDGYHYQGRTREWGAPPDEARAGAPSRSYDRTFNSGLMVIDGCLLTDAVHARLMSLVVPDIFQSATTRLADQMVLNMYFSGQQHLVGATYNYVLGHRATIYEREGIRLADAHVLHFNGDIKPWRPLQMLEASLADPALSRAYQYWSDRYAACLQSVSVRHRVGWPVAGPAPS